MNLSYAVERLLSTGWTPNDDAELERLPDGQLYPSVESVRTLFAREGLELTIRHVPEFNCHRASWSPKGASGDRHSGTVIGACEREAAVYALAQLRAYQSQEQLVTA